MYIWDIKSFGVCGFLQNFFREGGNFCWSKKNLGWGNFIVNSFFYFKNYFWAQTNFTKFLDNDFGWPGKFAKIIVGSKFSVELKKTSPKYLFSLFFLTTLLASKITGHIFCKPNINSFQIKVIKNIFIKIIWKYWYFRMQF